MTPCYQSGQQDENTTEGNGRHDKSLTRGSAVNFHVSKKTVCLRFTAVKHEWQFLPLW